MANLVQTRANVKIKTAGPIAPGIGGEVFDQGVPLYLSVGRYYKSDANQTPAKAEATVISVTPCDGAGEPFVYARAGCDLDLGATLQQGETYVVSATAGAICPIGDLLPGEYVKILGTAKTTAKLGFQPVVPTVQKPTTTTTTTTTS